MVSVIVELGLVHGFLVMILGEKTCEVYASWDCVVQPGEIGLVDVTAEPVM